MFDYHKNNFDNCIKKSLKSNDGELSYDIVKRIITKREKNTHKGDYGKCLVVAGSPGLTGAACMACDAMIKSGAGLVKLCCAKSLNNIYEIKLTETMTVNFDDDNGIIKSEYKDSIAKMANNSSCVLIGCGLSTNENIKEILEYLLLNVTVPVIIDADGINVLSENINILSKKKCKVVLTPHLVEFSRITGYTLDEIKNNYDDVAKEFCKKYNCIVVLKSHNTMIYDTNGNCIKNVLGNPGMATGGSGDVLAGIITSFAGQFKDVLKSSYAGVFIHSLAGDMACFDKGEYGMTPSDIIDYIPYAIKYMIGE